MRAREALKEPYTVARRSTMKSCGGTRLNRFQIEQSARLYAPRHLRLQYCVAQRAAPNRSLVHSPTSNELL